MVLLALFQKEDVLEHGKAEKMATGIFKGLVNIPFEERLKMSMILHVVYIKS